MRATHKVDRNVGDAIRAWGGISAQGIALLAASYAGLQVLELVTGVWSFVFGGPGGFVFPLLVTLIAAAALSRLERSHGAHFALSVVRFHLSRRRHRVFSPLVRPRYERSPYSRPRR